MVAYDVTLPRPGRLEFWFAGGTYITATVIDAVDKTEESVELRGCGLDPVSTAARFHDVDSVSLDATPDRVVYVQSLNTSFSVNRIPVARLEPDESTTRLW